MKVVFSNPGLIDLRTVSTFGVSVKEKDNPIGMFGTGLKYALAVLLRTGHAVTLWRDGVPLRVTKRVEPIRGKDHETLYLNGEPLPFTTHLGSKWELWQAYRELYCNALDEGGHAALWPDSEQPDTEGNTCIEVVGDAFAEVHRNRGKFILEGRTPLWTDGNIEIHSGQCDAIFYRGLAVQKLQNPSVYTYNILEEMTLTEDRTTRYGWEASSIVALRVARSDMDEGLMQDILLAPDPSFERSLTFADYHTPSEAFLRACEHHADDLVRLNPSAYRLFRDTTRRKGRAQVVALDELEEQQLEEARVLLRTNGVPIDKYPVVVVPDLGAGVLGLAEDNTIYLSRECFLRGFNTVAGTLYEEFIHLDKGFDDCTRALQNHLLDRLLHAWALLDVRRAAKRGG